MSDLLAGNTPSGAAGARRTQNGSGRPAPGPGGATTGRSGILTPTQIMANRAKRAEAAQRRTQDEEEPKRQPAENVVGVGDDGRQTSGRAPLSEIQSGPTPGTTGVTATRRRNVNIPTTNGAVPRTGAATNPIQARPVSAQQAAVADPVQINRNRTEALERLTTSMPAVAGARPLPPQQQQQQQTSTYPPQATSAQPSGRAPFPHAFERWETLSSHWEGLTGYWIRKLESNADELSGKPIDQQMARQITDLSAAGANLFHAVVELQRLRASSERKFQRWFLDTRKEQEQASERIADLERQVQHAENTGNTSSASIEAVKAEKTKAEELVREMRRELQISKEEARRAWEELGRREQEERERTIALRSGEPTLIGGVQVVPMAGMSSRHVSSTSRPQTRGGPIPGGPGPTQMSGQQHQMSEPRDTFSRSQTTLESPEQEQAQFTYQRGQTSPTETDPFTETSWANEPQPQQQLRHEPDTQFYSSPPRSQTRSGGGSTIAPAVTSSATTARTTVSPSRGQTQSTSPSRFYQGTSATAYQPTVTTAGTQRPITAGSDHRSYIPSTASGSGSDEQYHVNPDGSYTRDAHGRRIPSNQPISGPGIEEEGEGEVVEEEEDDDDDYTSDVERERMYAQQYSQRQAVISQVPRPAGTSLPTASAAPVHRTTTIPTTQSQPSPSSQSYSSTISATSQPMTQPPALPSDYEGAGYGDDDIPSNIVTGWENIRAAPRHHHPSRLSAISEERSGRTTPSRQSYVSEGNPAGQRPGGNNNGSAAQR